MVQGTRLLGAVVACTALISFTHALDLTIVHWNDVHARYASVLAIAVPAGGIGAVFLCMQCLMLWDGCSPLHVHNSHQPSKPGPCDQLISAACVYEAFAHTISAAHVIPVLVCMLLLCASQPL